MDPENPGAGCVYRGDIIYSVSGVDKTITTSTAFDIYNIYTDQDSLEYINVGSVLARCRFHNLRWDAGRVHIDGIRWEEETWAQDDFIAFRDHVADLLEVKPSPREELETMIANCGVTIRRFQRQLTRHNRESAAYAHFEGVIAEARQTLTELQADLKTLKSSPPETAPAAR